MKKIITRCTLAVLTLSLTGALAACASQGTPSANESSSAETGTPLAETSTPTYSENSLMAFHEGLGRDITFLTEVSKESCSQCHGDWTEIQEKTADILEKNGFTANPHANHMTKETTCENCHSLTEASTLSCDISCHTWEIPETTKQLWEE